MSRVRRFLLRAVAQIIYTYWAEPAMSRRPPDKAIMPTDGDVYLMRWHALPRNRFFNIYWHRVLRSDDDRALHDHPWPNISFPLQGGIMEHTIAAGGIHHKDWLSVGDIRIRWTGKHAHRLEVLPLQDKEYISMFIVGPRYREWGFHCPERGWIHWKDFTSEDGNSIDAGCD